MIWQKEESLVDDIVISGNTVLQFPLIVLVKSETTLIKI